MNILPIEKDGKVSAVVTFYNQENFKSQVLSSIVADQLIVIENKGNLTYQRNLGLAQAQHEFVLFCDGDIVVDKDFVMQAKVLIKNLPAIAIVGGLITTPMETITQELMGILRYRAFHKSNQVYGCFMVRRELFNVLKFDEPPHELNSFYAGIKKLGLKQDKIKYKLLHLGEPKTIPELYARQCKYGVSEKYNVLHHLLFSKLFIGRQVFRLYKDYIYQMIRDDGFTFKHSYEDLSWLYAGFMQIYHTTAIVRKKVENND